MQWRDNGFLWVYTTDANPEQDDTCITYDARPSTNGPYSAYALVGSTAEINALFSKLGGSDNPYGVLGSANACTITKQ